MLAKFHFILFSICSLGLSSQVDNSKDSNSIEQSVFNYYLESQLKEKVGTKIKYQFKGYSENSEKVSFTYFDTCPDYSSAIKSNKIRGEIKSIEIPSEYSSLVKTKNFRINRGKKSIRLYNGVRVENNMLVVIEVFDNNEFFSEIYYLVDSKVNIIDECFSSEVY